jgi:hypothetical protein
MLSTPTAATTTSSSGQAQNCCGDMQEEINGGGRRWLRRFGPSDGQNPGPKSSLGWVGKIPTECMASSFYLLPPSSSSCAPRLRQAPYRTIAAPAPVRRRLPHLFITEPYVVGGGRVHRLLYHHRAEGRIREVDGRFGNYRFRRDICRDVPLEPVRQAPGN